MKRDLIKGSDGLEHNALRQLIFIKGLVSFNKCFFSSYSVVTISLGSNLRPISSET
jgi:hypothetical protein